MKTALFILLSLYCHIASAQSPGLSVKFKIDSSKTGSLGFTIQMKFCQPLKRSSSVSYFSNDTSTIDFKKLTAKDVKCERYIDNYNNDSSPYDYYFSNQVFAWEKIIVWKISAASRDWKEPMYVILPVKINSFVTFIDIKDVAFEAGKCIMIDEYGKIEANKYQGMLFSLKNQNGTDKKIFFLKEILN